MLRIWTRLAVTAIALASLAPPALAEAIGLKAELTGAAQVPPADTRGSGEAVVSYDTATKTLSWTVTYRDLSGPPTAAHFHGPAEPGRNAGIAVPFTGNLASPVEGSAMLTDQQAADLLAGRLYINVHTAARPGGEIRGQVVKE